MINIKSTLRLLTTIVLASLTLFSCSCNDDDDPTIVNIQIYSANGYNLHVDTSEQFEATAIFSDGANQDVTSDATWTSSDSTVAVVSTTGIVKTIGAGTTDIVASYSNVESKVAVSVTNLQPQAIFISRDRSEIYVGVSAQLTAIGVYVDGSSQDLTNDVVWVTDNSSIVMVSNDGVTSGEILGVGIGSTNITAAFGSVSNSTVVEVLPDTIKSIHIVAETTDIHKGLEEQLTAIGVYASGNQIDITADTLWSTSDEFVATISNQAGSQGLMKAVNTGAVEISINFGGIMSAKIFTVLDALMQSISIEGTPIVALNNQTQLLAIATFSDESQQDITSDATWITSDNDIVSVNQTGTVVGNNLGSAVVTAQLFSLVGEHSIVVSGTDNVQIVTNTSELRSALLTASNNGREDLILLLDGNYSVNNDGLGTFVYDTRFNENLTLKGTHAQNVILDGNNTDPVLYFTAENANIKLSSLSITNGFAESIDPGQHGGGAFLSVLNATVDKCVFANNNSSNNGGALFGVIDGDTVITNSIFANNSAVPTVGGGGQGGAIFISGNSDLETLTIDNVIFDGNTAGYYSGAVYAGITKIMINNTVFSNNVAEFAAAFSAGITVSADITNTIFDSNTSTNAFRKNVLEWLAYKNSKTITNSLFINNSGGVYIKVSSIPSQTDYFTNTIFRGNVSDDISGTVTTNIMVNACFIDTAKITVPFTEMGAVFNNSPNFVDEANGNYRLTGSSIMVDTGISSHPDFEIPTTDLDGVSRPIGTSTDIGPYEFDPLNP